MSEGKRATFPLWGWIVLLLLCLDSFPEEKNLGFYQVFHQKVFLIPTLKEPLRALSVLQRLHLLHVATSEGKNRAEIPLTQQHLQIPNLKFLGGTGAALPGLSVV